MFTNHPKMAKKWEKHPPQKTKLPEKSPQLILRSIHKKYNKKGK